MITNELGQRIKVWRSPVVPKNLSHGTPYVIGVETGGDGINFWASLEELEALRNEIDDVIEDAVTEAQA